MIKAKSIFISDLHIGSKKVKAEQLLEFLKNIECENLFLIGDIIDMWSLSRKWYFPQSHLLLMRQILSLSKRGIHVYYIRGNHDDPIIKYLHDVNIGDIKIVNELDHYINGKKFKIIHGDQYDVITKYHLWIAKLGDHAYEFSVWLNNHVNNLRFLLGMKYWSLSKFLKNKVKSAVKFIFAFEDAAIESVKQMGYDGIICGHIHAAKLRVKHGVVYANDGDWCESLSWIVESYDGKLQIWEWNGGESKMNAELQI